MSDNDKAYIGIEPCGCVTFVSVAGVVSKTEERRTLKKVMKDGRKVELTTVGEARKRLVARCPHPHPPPESEREDTIEALIEKGRA